MMSKQIIAMVSLALLVAGCTRQIIVQEIKPGSNITGITKYDLGDSNRVAAIDVIVAADDIHSLIWFGNSNVNLLLHRCGSPDDYYPAYPYFSGKLFDEDAVDKASQSGRPITLTFYLPEQVQRRGMYDCATLDARGMASIVRFQSRIYRLPKTLRFEALPHSPANGS